jgi:hypothetical protein
MTSALIPAGVHEAGHVVVACALGRGVTFVRLGSQPVPEDHPHRELLKGSITGGESRFSPAFGLEISKRVKCGLPLTPEHVEWLRIELVTCFAGRLAEVQLLSSASDESWLADAQQAAIIIGFLGIKGDADGGEARIASAGNIADRILVDLSRSLERVAAKFSQGPSEFDEPAIASLLQQSGIRRGSHRELLHDLDAEQI